MRYVVLTGAPPDYSARGEAALLRGGRSGLRVVLRTGRATVYRLPHPRPIVTGAGHPRVAEFEVNSLVLELSRPGTLRVAARFSPYWRSNGGCIVAAPDGMLELHARRAGRVRLRVSVSAARALAVVAGAGRACDAAESR